MSGSRFFWGSGGWLALMQLAAGAEMSTVVYVVDRVGFDELGNEWHWRGSSAGMEIDPFAEDADAAEKFVVPTRLEQKPNGSRFFADEDRMWLLTGTLRQQKILENEGSWAVWNEDRNRLVVHGTTREQGWVAILWEDLHRVLLVETSVELVKVRCRELTGVAWTEAEVRKRGGRVVHAIATTARPGQKTSAVMGTEAGAVRMEVEPNTNHVGDLVDLRLNYEAAVRHADGIRKLTVNTGMAIFGGHRMYIEVGGAGGGDETYLLGVESFTKCMDGTPRWRWREFEDESLQEKPIERLRERFEKNSLENGMTLSRVWVPPTFLTDISNEEDGDVHGLLDPRNNRKQARAMGVPVAKSLAGVPGCLVTDVVFDLTDYMKELGLVAPVGGWIYYNQTRGVLVAKLNEEGSDILDARVNFEAAGVRPVRLQTGLTVIDGEPVVVPLGEDGGKKLGVVMACRVMDGTGTEVGR